MLVKTPTGLICPKEGKRREYITDDKNGTEVPETSYYRRLLDEGSLIKVEARTEDRGSKEPPEPAAKGEKQ